MFLDEELKTQTALKKFGITADTPHSLVPHVGTILMIPERIPELRIPYVVEVLGMPRAGKTTLINRYLHELWSRDEQHKIAHIVEGARTIKGEYGDLRYSNPFAYSMLGGMANFVGILEGLKGVKHGMRMMASDRGQIDRRVFRRALFSLGAVNPGIMEREDAFMYGLENTPLQVGAVIMVMAKRETSLARSKRPGPVANMKFLPRLYEQYWRLHTELSEGKIPYRLYTCIDGEENKEAVYERFKYAMDSALNLHRTYLAALAKAFPHEFDEAQHKFRNRPQRRHPAEERMGALLGGKRVLIVGGDDMASKEELFQLPLIEGMRVDK